MRGEIIASNGRTVSEFQCSEFADLQKLVRAVGLYFLDRMRTQFEAVRFETEDGEIFVYSIYDRACEFFGVKALTVGQMPVFREFLARGLI
jgi:hypothetical protein